MMKSPPKAKEFSEMCLCIDNAKILVNQSQCSECINFNGYLPYKLDSELKGIVCRLKFRQFEILSGLKSLEKSFDEFLQK
mmetsp:Transcript_38240/g.43846  ORF Transcript_38240/g.43846 Transcript_38240/m.43846 type:complete len:80 (+) Transcript_38240:245-484(+)